MTHYRQNSRFEPSIETAAIVAGKLQAMHVLDLLLSFQFNSRLESFVSKFKAAEQSEGLPKAKKTRSPMAPLLYDDFNPFDTAKKSVRIQRKALKELRAMFGQTSYFDSDQITNILMDLSNYKYDSMVSMSLLLLNKFYSAKTKMFKLAVNALVLTTSDSCHVHREVARTMPIIRRYSRSKLTDEQVNSLGSVLERYAEFCLLPNGERHPINQNILINHEVLTLVLDMLSQPLDCRLLKQYDGLACVLRKGLKLLAALSKGNEMVQNKVFERLDTLLSVKLVEPDVALALIETFVGNEKTCLNILPSQVQTIVQLAAKHHAPEFLLLLQVIIKVQEVDVTLKRNQSLVMKFVMHDYSKVAGFILDATKDEKENVLTGKNGPRQLAYAIRLVELLAACAEGENRFIESMCQNILTVEEVLWVLNHDDISPNVKLPFLHFLLWVYLKTAGSAVESGAGDLPHDPGLWAFVNRTSVQCFELHEYIRIHQENAASLLKKPPPTQVEPENVESVVLSTLHCFLNGVLPVLQAFYSKFYQPDREINAQELEITDKIASGLVDVSNVYIPLETNVKNLKNILSCLAVVLPNSNISNTFLEDIVESIRSPAKLRSFKGEQSMAAQREYYAAELDLNAKLRSFAVNASLLYGGHNTVVAQLKGNWKCGKKRVYTNLGGDDELPLGDEFQEHLKRFLKPSEKKISKRLELVKKIIEQLAISARTHRKLTSEVAKSEQDDLDVRCLQILRAIIHNEERKLAENWEEHVGEHSKQIDLIRQLQIELNEMKAVVVVLPHLARQSDRVVKEVLSFVCIMLFNANSSVQSSLLYYFLHTREESFFAAIRQRMHLSALAIKERRSLVAQRMARTKEGHGKSILHGINANCRAALNELNSMEVSERRERENRKLDDRVSHLKYL